MKRLALGIFVAAVAVVPSAFAHHSFSSYYFEDQSMSVEGPVQEFLYRNPHAWVKIGVPGEQGATITYSAEWAGAGRLERMGITPETIKPGDVVKITGAPGRVSAENRLHLKAIERPADGWSWGGFGRDGRRGRR